MDDLQTRRMICAQCNEKIDSVWDHADVCKGSNAVTDSVQPPSNPAMSARDLMLAIDEIRHAGGRQDDNIVALIEQHAASARAQDYTGPDYCASWKEYAEDLKGENDKYEEIYHQQVEKLATAVAEKAELVDEIKRIVDWFEAVEAHQTSLLAHGNMRQAANNWDAATLVEPLDMEPAIALLAKHTPSDAGSK